MTSNPAKGFQFVEAAAEAELLAAGFGLLIRFVDRLAGMRMQCVRFACYNGITATRDQRLQDIHDVSQNTFRRFSRISFLGWLWKLAQQKYDENFSRISFLSALVRFGGLVAR